MVEFSVLEFLALNDTRLNRNIARNCWGLNLYCVFTSYSKSNLIGRLQDFNNTGLQVSSHHIIYLQSQNYQVPIFKTLSFKTSFSLPSLNELSIYIK